MYFKVKRHLTLLRSALFKSVHKYFIDVILSIHTYSIYIYIFFFTRVSREQNTVESWGLFNLTLASKHASSKHIATLMTSW